MKAWLLLLMLFSCILPPAARAEDLGPPRAGDEAPDFVLQGRGLASFRLSSLRGSPVLLHFTASWCPYCEAEIDRMKTFAKEYSGRVTIVVVDVQEGDREWAWLSKRVLKSITLLRDRTGDAAARFAPQKAQPFFTNRAEVILGSNILLDAAGRIVSLGLIDTAGDGGAYDAELKDVRQNLGKILVPDPAGVLTILPSVGEGALQLKLQIAPGYHVMSDQPSAPNFIPTRVTVESVAPAGALALGEPRYPSPSLYDFSGSPIKTFLGQLTVAVPFKRSAEASSEKILVKGKVRYQACTATRCLFPRETPFEIEVR